MGSNPESKSPEGGNGYLLQYSCLGNPMDRGAWQATVDGVPKSWTRLRNYITTTTMITTRKVGDCGRLKPILVEMIKVVVN